MLAVARMLIAQGTQHYAEAEQLLETALSIFRKSYTLKPDLIAQAENALGGIRLKQNSLRDAERLLMGNPELLLTAAKILLKLLH